jgi:dTDP-4-amino-4,6-dideoxygalactose transaminase
MDFLSKQTYYRGRVALYAILKGLGIQKGGNVIMQAFTCLAVPEGIMATGAKPLYVDILADGFTMDPVDLASKINRKTQAIIVQHTFGIPADMDQVLRIAHNWNIPVIEDCCHTLVSKYKGMTVGSFGIGSFYSFEWGKPLVAGIGWSTRSNAPVLLENIQTAYTGYQFPDLVLQAKIELQYQAFSLLYRPSLYWPIRSLFHLLGSLGVAEGNYNPVGTGKVATDFKLRMAPMVKRRMFKKLKGIEENVRHSRWVSDQYQKRILSKAVFHPIIQGFCDTVFARYPLLAKNKQDLLSRARRERVELAEWYATPIHPLMGQDLALVNYKIGTCPNAEARCQEIVTLPVHKMVRKKDIDHMVEFLNKVDV